MIYSQYPKILNQIKKTQHLKYIGVFEQWVSLFRHEKLDDLAFWILVAKVSLMEEMKSFGALAILNEQSSDLAGSFLNCLISSLQQDFFSDFSLHPHDFLGAAAKVTELTSSPQ